MKHEMKNAPEYQILHNDLACRIGRCLNNWAVCEVYLSLLFRTVIRSRNSESSHAAFSSISNMQTKLSATKKAAEKSVKSSALLYAVQKHLKRMQKLNEKRNELAHSCIRNFNGKPYVNPYFSLAYNENDNKRFDALAMARKENSFSELSLAMRWIAMKTWLHIENTGEDPGPPPLQTVCILPNTIVTYRSKQANK